jgi:hypothetical protein
LASFAQVERNQPLNPNWRWGVKLSAKRSFQACRSCLALLIHWSGLPVLPRKAGHTYKVQPL